MGELEAVVIRPARREDLRGIERSGARWPAEDYLNYDCLVADAGGEVAGFVAWRDVGGEREVLDLAVAPSRRRQGIATRLIRQVLTGARACFLEVRESNTGARRLYESQGFREAGRRRNYYDDPPECAIVMSFFS